MPILIDLTKQTFGKLKVLSKVNSRPVAWLCQCECGITKEVLSSSLREGIVTSCGNHPEDLLVSNTPAGAYYSYEACLEFSKEKSKIINSYQNRWGILQRYIDKYTTENKNINSKYLKRIMIGLEQKIPIS